MHLFVLRILTLVITDCVLFGKESLFDVTMGVYDGAEVCELVGTYMLNVLSKNYKTILKFTLMMDWPRNRWNRYRKAFRKYLRMDLTLLYSVT